MIHLWKDNNSFIQKNKEKQNCNFCRNNHLSEFLYTFRYVLDTFDVQKKKFFFNRKFVVLFALKKFNRIRDCVSKIVCACEDIHSQKKIFKCNTSSNKNYSDENLDAANAQNEKITKLFRSSCALKRIECFTDLQYESKI